MLDLWYVASESNAHNVDQGADFCLQWSHIEQTSKSSIQEKKIRVLFLPADDAAATPAKTNGLGRDSLLPSPSPEAFTPLRGVADTTGPSSLRDDHSADNRSLAESHNDGYSSAPSGGIQSTVAAAATSVKNAMPSQVDLQNQLNDAKAQIARLTQQVGESSGLRQRKPDAGSDSKAAASTAVDTRQAPAGGVPIHITALLCLVSFLLAYFLF